MFSKVTSFGVYALDGFVVTVETDISGGLPQFDIVGLPDSSVKEAKDRVRSALKNAGYEYPKSRVTVNLAPADVRKTGPVYDLPIFVALLCAGDQIKPPPQNFGFVGELSLNGEVREITGVLPMAIAAKEAGITTLFVPFENALEANAIEGLTVFGVKKVRELCLHLDGKQILSPTTETSKEHPVQEFLDLQDVRGQYEAKRALEIAAAGMHNLIFMGPPGTGKSMLAKRLPSILPPMFQTESIETTKIYSVAGLLQKGSSLMIQRPFRAPHHSVSAAGLSGGGAVPRPGEISLAHNGVLFLDELPEFSRDALEILRQPLEEGIVTVSRVAGTVTFPCKTMLVAAMNPCPCGYATHPTKSCNCSQFSIDRYLRKVSGPLLDRIDLHVEVIPLEYGDLAAKSGGEKSADILKRVELAREIQKKRFEGTGINFNAQIPSKLIRAACEMDTGAEFILQKAFEKMSLSARAYDKILKVSRTIADLDGSKAIQVEHITEAVQYRNLDRKYWYSK